jgi:hypothetical protein
MEFHSLNDFFHAAEITHEVGAALTETKPLDVFLEVAVIFLIK